MLTHKSLRPSVEITSYDDPSAKYGDLETKLKSDVSSFCPSSGMLIENGKDLKITDIRWNDQSSHECK